MTVAPQSIFPLKYTVVSESTSPEANSKIMTNHAGEILALDIFKASFDTLSLKQGKNAEFVQSNRSPAFYNLSPEKADWISLPFGLELKDFGGKSPGLISGDVEYKTTHLAASLDIAPELKDRLAALDGTLKNLSKATGSWTDMIKENRARVKVQFAGYNPTPIKLVVADAGGNKKVVSGCGWSFIEPYAKEHDNFRCCRVKTTVAAARIWSYGGKRGVTLNVDQLVIDCVEKTARTNERVAPEFMDVDLL